MASARFKTKIPEYEMQQTHAFDRVVNGTDMGNI
jgi:hypothetical protein